MLLLYFQKIRETRQFWAHLPYQYCNNITAAPNESEKCWNGTFSGEYTKDSKKASAPVSPLINEQVYSLQVFTDKLRKAYQGEEVEIVDDSEDIIEGSGSGSGDFDIVDPVEPEENTPAVKNDFDIVEDNEVQEPVSSTSGPDTKKTFTGGASSISLSKALAQYLLPIVLVWFGGAISDML